MSNIQTNVTFINEGSNLNIVAPYKVAFGSTMYQGGIQREVLEYQFDESSDLFQTLMEVYKHGATEIIQQYTAGQDEEGVPIIDVSTHLNYLIPIELGIRVVDEEQRIILRLAQLNKIELMQQELDIRMSQIELVIGAR